MLTAYATTRLARPATRVLMGLAGLLLLGSFGCRSSTDNQIDLLERELRTQEDYIYELEDYVLEYSEKLRQCRYDQPQQIALPSRSLEPKLAPKRTTDKPKRRVEEEHLVEEPAALPDPIEPETEPVESPSPALDELDIPELELENVDPVGIHGEDPPVEATVVAKIASDSNNDLASLSDDAEVQAATSDEPLDDEYVSEAEFQEQLFQEEPEEEFLGYRVAERLVITKVFWGAGESPDSLLTIVEARDANDEPVDLDGKVSLMVMTADRVSPQRLKRWDFDSEETASAWQSSQLGDGLHLELPLAEWAWPEEPMELWVRMVGTDGRKLLAQLPLQQEQLTSVEAAMDAGETQTNNAVRLAENNAQPLRHEEHNILRTAEEEPVQSTSEEKSDDAQSRWRASMQRSHAVANGYSTTASGEPRGWTSQPTGGRPAFSLPARAQKPTWNRANSLAPSPSQASSKQPRWSPPR